MSALKNEIIGSWKLLSYIEVPVGGEEYLFPLGNNPKGLLIYSPDGCMSVQISVKDPIRYDSDDRFSVDDNKIATRVKGYIAFAGKYTTDNFLSQVTYHIETSLNPNWEGAKQVRKLDFEGDVLYQKSVEPIPSDGQMVHAYMTWQRVSKLLEDDEKIGDRVEESY
ncbi:lipocalin-like domain-containing protein [Sphingobacterium bovistauri]|uniref:Lipocalin-like domain-containing protein n=1 Tax=Sphingobacterium bovistauri TaxID=2781959 RepID=A0ABS7Z8A4_9SPHI|nr:lipocalin-like domain-containing protein [Sphingobacterium bovistauri]MCA5005772.1 lipocalin-like domain-containing protein [Sphingobacterium bovistauri]